MKGLVSRTLILAFAFGVFTEATASWNVATDFRTDNGNPNGAWSYGIKNAADLGGVLHLFPDSGYDSSWMYWRDNSILVLGAPACARNMSEWGINGAPPGSFVMHPGQGDQIATTRFTAPNAGGYRIFGTYLSGDWGTVDQYVYADGVSLLADTNSPGPTSFYFNLSLGQGSVVDFMVGNAGNFYFDTTPLSLVVVPDGRVNGVAVLNGYEGVTDGQLLRVEVWQYGSKVEILNGGYGPYGSFAFSPSISGPMTLKFQFRTGLWKAVDVDLGIDPINNLNVDMLNGDMDNNNVIDLGDFDLLAASFGAGSEDPNYNANADLNADFVIDLGDFDLLAAGFGAEGD